MFFSKNQNEQFKRKDDMKVVELYFCFLILTFDIAESEKKNISDPVELKESSLKILSLWFLNHMKDKHGCHKSL